LKRSVLPGASKIAQEPRHEEKNKIIEDAENGRSIKTKIGYE
jgi:hypothetical protein